MQDIIGNALLDYIHQRHTEDIITTTSISDEDVMPVAHFFRDFNTMPIIEQKALTISRGSVLDIGCGAGSHSLYLQNTRRLEVTSIDISKGAIEVCELRGIKNAKKIDYFEMKGIKFDTILALMNGTGLFQSFKNIIPSLKHLKSLLKKNGQILIDSSDIIYMYDTDEDGGVWIPTDTDYYGELKFHMSYKGEKSGAFNWLYLDFDTLKNACALCGLSCELIVEGEHYDYLAKLSAI